MANQWSHANMGTETAWDFTVGSNEVNIGLALPLLCNYTTIQKTTQSSGLLCITIDSANTMLYNCGRSTIKWGLGYEKNIIVFSFMFLLYPFI